MHSPANSEGLLRQAEQDYLDCLELGHRNLEELLRRDALFWDQELEKVKQEADKVQE